MSTDVPSAVDEWESSMLDEGTASAPPFVVSLRGLCHTHVSRRGDSRFVLTVEELQLPLGAFVSILGPSGCGKTTMLTVLGSRVPPSCCHPQHPAVKEFVIREPSDEPGEPWIEHDLAALRRRGARGERHIEALRRRLLGFCLQNGELLPTLTVRQNVAMPLRLNGWGGAALDGRIGYVLDHLLQGERKELEKRLACLVSGGQYQRVALARAIVHQPRIAFIDEPTSNLDRNSARRALDLVARCADDEGATVVMITHDAELAREYSEYIVVMHSPEADWGAAVPFPRRPNDGWGTIARFERKLGVPVGEGVQDIWVEADAQWRVVRPPATDHLETTCVTLQEGI